MLDSVVTHSHTPTFVITDTSRKKCVSTDKRDNVLELYLMHKLDKTSHNKVFERSSP